MATPTVKINDLQKRLDMAVHRIEDMLMGDDAQAWKEAEKWLPYIRGEDVKVIPPDEIGYMCKVDFDHELYAAKGGCEVYPTVEELRELRPCVEECGIVAVHVKLIEVVQEEDL